MTLAQGVLPDDVIRDPRSEGELIYLTIKPDATKGEMEAFLKSLTAAVDELTSEHDQVRAATACVGFGKPFFARALTVPIGLQAAPAPAVGALIDADIVIYAMSNEEWRMADFRRKLAGIGHGLVIAVTVDRGYQRPDGRELGGFLDGLRNPKENRESIVFVDRDRDPEEPRAAEGGSYMVTMRVTQDLIAWNALAEADQEAIMGRRKADGSRLDLAAGTAVDAEPEIGAGCPLASHVAKAGPRGSARDRVKIFRRGLPFVDLLADGTVEVGLLFVSFQGSMTQFLTLSGEWMGNADFPEPATGQDALFARGMATVVRTGFFFVPAPAEYLGAQFLTEVADDDRCVGHIAIRKLLVDQNGQPLRAERGGFGFQLVGQDGTTIGDTFTTDSTGRTLSPPVPMGDTYIVREVTARPGFDLAPEQTVVLDRKRMQLEFTNKATTPANPGYGR